MEATFKKHVIMDDKKSMRHYIDRDAKYLFGKKSKLSRIDKYAENIASRLGIDQSDLDYIKETNILIYFKINNENAFNKANVN